MPSVEPTAAPLVPLEPTFDSVRAAAAGCRACPIGLLGGPTIFGEGPTDAAFMLVGEQPGDQEDKHGHPFVGPAGKMLDKCLEAAGVDRSRAWVTNAVKHFKWERSGKRRMHQKPAPREVRACHPWLGAEVALVQPKLVVFLGSTAAQSVFGAAFKVTERRGEVFPWQGRLALATVHPSSLLRTVDPDSRKREIDRFVDDLRKILPALG
jgi:uracil-DNA glycosylase family protein